MAANYYVRTRAGAFRDDRREFTRKWKGVAEGDLTASDFANRNLEIETAKEHAKSGRRTKKSEGGADDNSEPDLGTTGTAEEQEKDAPN